MLSRFNPHSPLLPADVSSVLLCLLGGGRPMVAVLEEEADALVVLVAVLAVLLLFRFERPPAAVFVPLARVQAMLGARARPVAPQLTPAVAGHVAGGRVV